MSAKARVPAVLDRLASPAPADCPDLLVAAHPDDETIALGGQLARLRGLLYARFDWGLTAEAWLAAVRATRRALDLPAWL